MNKPSLFIIRNIWWLVPLSVVLLFWAHTAPILLMLAFAYLGRVILYPIVRVIEKGTGNHNWSVIIAVSYTHPTFQIQGWIGIGIILMFFAYLTWLAFGQSSQEHKNLST